MVCHKRMLLFVLHALLYAHVAVAITTTMITTEQSTMTTSAGATMAGASTFDPYVMCSLIADGVMVKDPRACNTWIKCVNGEPVTGTCTSNLFYDRVTQDCVPADTVKCISSDPCAANAGADGFVADPYKCNGYYYCHGGAASHGACPNGLNFNAGTQDCIRDFPCVAIMNPNDYCNIVPDGVFIKDENNCNGWQTCWRGAVVQGACPAGFSFSPLRGVCDYPDQVACVTTTTVPPDMPSTDECVAVGDFIADGRTCNGYYYCQATANGGIRLRHAVCVPGRFFDPHYVNAVGGEVGVGACVNRTQVTCALNRCVGMGESAIQLANESSDGCIGYAICQAGEQIGAGTCPHGEYFDEVTQLCTTLTISYPACALSTTTLASDAAAPTPAATVLKPADTD